MIWNLEMNLGALETGLRELSIKVLTAQNGARMHIWLPLVDNTVAGG
jgi:hypothetical protein